eukprot:7383166-Prymnesium_polylepis.1
MLSKQSSRERILSRSRGIFFCQKAGRILAAQAYLRKEMRGDRSSISRYFWMAKMVGIKWTIRTFGMASRIPSDTGNCDAWGLASPWVPISTGFRRRFSTAPRARAMLTREPENQIERAREQDLDQRHKVCRNRPTPQLPTINCLLAPVIRQETRNAR